MVEVLERSSSAAAFLSGAIRRGALGLLGVGSAPRTSPLAENEARRRMADGAAYRAAHARLVGAVDDLIAAYEPGLYQQDLDAADWRNPVAMHHVLKPEIERIRHHVWNSLRELGFPVETSFDVLRAELEQSAKHLIWQLHQKVFADLRVPVFFEMRGGFVDYEPTYETATKVLGVRVVTFTGVSSAHRYDEPFYRGRKPSLHDIH